MPDTKDLQRLAERVEALSEYDGRLMAEIDCAVFYRDLRPAERDDHPSVKDRVFDPSAIWTPTGWLMSHNYFRSLDDAVRLVPKDAFWRVGHDGEGADPSLFLATVFIPQFGRANQPHDAVAETPALALTAASLRARIGGAG